MLNRELGDMPIKYRENGADYVGRLFLDQQVAYQKAWNARKQTGEKHGKYEFYILTKDGATYDEEAEPYRKATLHYTDGEPLVDGIERYLPNP